MANVKEIFGSLLIVFGIMVTIGATFMMLFFYFLYGGLFPIFISFAVVLVGLSVLVVGIILYCLSKKSVEVEASTTYKSTTRMIGIYLTIYGALITIPGILLQRPSWSWLLIIIMAIVILLIGIVFLVIGRKK